MWLNGWEIKLNLLCYDFLEGITHEEEDLIFAIELKSFPSTLLYCWIHQLWFV